MTTLREAILRARQQAGGAAVFIYPTCPDTHCRAPNCDCALEHRVVITADDQRSLEEIMASLTVN